MNSHFSQLLTSTDGCPWEVKGSDGSSPILIVCEHASNLIPATLASLGASEETLSSHAAWDPGALSTAEMLAEKLDATLIYQRFSRLVYDCNRPPSASSAMPEISEVHRIPGNSSLDAQARAMRIREIYRPFHARIADEIDRRASEQRRTVLVTMHSFTPIYNGRYRQVQLGILHDTDSRLADRMLRAITSNPEYWTGRNEPYGPRDGVTHTLQLHGIANCLENVMIEIRNDLISDSAGQEKAASYLAGILRATVQRLPSA